MSQPTGQPEDLEEGNISFDNQLDPQSTHNRPSQGESNFGDGSGPFFSTYSKAADDADSKMVERWQKVADRILIFAGLFSVAVAVLLTVTVQDLRPNSQDTSTFYLGNIYDVLADPNATRTSIAKSPPFSPPNHAIWVNSLWFLSFVISLSCALCAVLLHQWTLRYIKVTQLERCGPEKRARMRAFFVEGMDKMHIPWAIEGLPTLLHLSVFYFLAGLLIFLFNIDHAVFSSVIWWIVPSSIVYGLVTVMPILRHNSPYWGPLSPAIWFLYTGINCVLSEALFKLYRNGTSESLGRFRTLKIRYHGWMLGGIRKAAEETISEQSSEIDIRIFDWTIGVLKDDDNLEKFFEAIPGFFSSKLVGHLESDFPDDVLTRFWRELNGFMVRTLSSSSVIESIKTRRVIICRDIISMIPCPYSSLYDALSDLVDQAPVSIERLQAMARWRTHKDDYVSNCARITVARNLASMRKRDDDWITFASGLYDIAAHDLRDKIVYAGDNVLLASLIDICRRNIHPDELWLLTPLTQIDICRTIPGLQHDFCMLWNETVQEARNRGPRFIYVHILRLIRHLYIALHQGTDASAAPTASNLDSILLDPSSYPLCDISSHRPDSTAHLLAPLTQHGHARDASPHHSTSGGITVSRQVKEASIIPGPPSLSHPTAPSKIGDSSQVYAVTSPSSLFTDASPPCAVATALQNIPPAATLAASPSNPLLPLSSLVGFSIPALPLLPNAESLALLSGTIPFRSAGNTTLPYLRTRGLVNTGSMSFANTVLQLLVHSPPFWNLFWELGNMKGQHGAGNMKTGGGATPLVDATLRFFEEFVFKEKELLPTQQSLQHAAGGRLREDDEIKKEHSAVEPTYVYDAMKEKRQLKHVLDGKRQDAEEFFRLYLDALDEELLTLLSSTNGQKLVTAAPGVEEREVSQSGLTDVGKRFMVESVESPLTRMFGGKLRSTVRASNQPDTVTTEDWRLLQLDIQHDSVHAVEDALARISHLQLVELGPSGFNSASQQVQIEALPPVLVLHLKRFLYDVAADDIAKTSKPVRFAPELEIPLEIMAPVAGKPAESRHYKLYGVLYHHGKSAGSGQYTVDLLHQSGEADSREAWLRIDDEAVSTVRHEDVFGGHGNEQAL